MDGRKSNKLPEGMGKKIVEALKRQSVPANQIQSSEKKSSFDDLINTHIAEDESEMNSYREEDNSGWVDDYKETAPDNEYEDNVEENYEYETEDDTQVEEFKYHELMDEDDLDSYDYYQSEAEEDHIEERQSSKQSFEEEMSQMETYTPQNRVQHPQKAPSRSREQQSPMRPNRQYNDEKPVQPKQELYVDTSSNIEVLMGLVAQLPSGVTRQTGAQIIRQTMEAIGFSMNKVLKEAQFAQAELAQAIRDNINTIEEYRNNIKILEKDVQKYKRKAEELEDLISLFILTEKERSKN